MCRWRIRVIKDPPFGSVHLTKDDLSEYANHHAFLSLPSWEIAAGLHDTAPIDQPRPESVGREGPGTTTQALQKADQRAGEGRSSARARKQEPILTAKDHPGSLLAPEDAADASRLPAGGTLLGQDRGTCSL